MEIQITAVSDNARIVAVKTGGMYAPLAACDPPRSEIIATALELLVAQQGDVLRSLLTALPRGGVPLPDTEIHLTREAATTAWTVSTETVTDEMPDTVVVGRHLAVEEVIERVRVAGGRAVVVYRDNNSLHARAARAWPSSGLTWSEVMADIDDQTGADS